MVSPLQTKPNQTKPNQTKPNQINEVLSLLVRIKTPFLAIDAGKGVFLFRQELHDKQQETRETLEKKQE